MSDLQVTIRLDSEREYYAPGEQISGVVTLRNIASWQARYVEVALGWRTSGRGDQNAETAGLEVLATLKETMQPYVERRFTFTLPPGPWTYYGNLIKIHWTVGVYARELRGKEVVSEIGIVLHPRGEQLRMPPAFENPDE